MPRTRAIAPKPQEKKSEETRQQILKTALELFRRKGFERTTMRDVATAAGVSLGASYYYFPSKEAMVMAYYDFVQREHRRLAEAALVKANTLRERLGIAFHTKLDILRNDRSLLTALFRYGGDRDHPLSWFGPATRAQREESMAVFSAALAEEKLPRDIRDLAPLVLWTLHMGIILFFVYDSSASEKRTRKLIDDALDLAVQVLGMVSNPLLQPVLKPTRERVLKMLRDAGIAEL
jgi:AcrR family transcriptional regulator